MVDKVDMPLTRSEIMPAKFPLSGRSWAGPLVGICAMAGVACLLSSSVSRKGSAALRSTMGQVTQLYEAPKIPAFTAVFHKGWPCEPGEEMFFGECYVSCDVATNGTHPKRNQDCTCCEELPCIDTLALNDCATFDVGAGMKAKHPPFLTDCPDADEELYLGLCYTKCSDLTKGYYKIRTGSNTCSSGLYGGDWTMGFGPCSGFGVGGTACLPHIPKATGAGYDGHAATDHDVGVAPMGWTEPPLPNRAKAVMPEIPAPALKALKVITKPR
ncbi:unnamed protein product [Polarella glacialis]|uniref:Uncharacterized protein n=1 Tax=Polarella glacialis TaxID=89957 RepID=A0A813JUM0_POLGL|nr:unnamed protein product [Polarella glacialis]